MFGKVKHDEGFSIVEVVFAVAIFFIGFMAIMTLMETNMMSSAKAKEKAVLVNAAASYIETARQLPYHTIGLASSNPTGTLDPQTVTYSNGFTITIVPTVTWVDDPVIGGTEDYKRLDLALTGELTAKPGSMVMNYETSAVLSAAGGMSSQAMTLPTVSFVDDSTPAENAILAGSGVNVKAQATANGLGVKLTTVGFEIDGAPLIQLGGAPAASFPVGAPSYLGSVIWDTTAMNDNVPATAFVADGWHTIKFSAWDSNGQVAYVQRRVYVANHAPETPSGLTFGQTSSTQLQAFWNEALDGVSPADHYTLAGELESITGAFGNAVTVTTATNSAPFAVVPFSRYLFTLRSFGPTNLTEGQAYAYAISRPVLSGSDVYVKVQGKMRSTVTLSSISVPTFPATITGVNIIQATNAAMTDNRTVVAASLPWTGPTRLEPLTKYYYQAEVTLTLQDGSVVTVCSNVLGPSATTNGALAQVW